MLVFHPNVRIFGRTKASELGGVLNDLLHIRCGRARLGVDTVLSIAE